MKDERRIKTQRGERARERDSEREIERENRDGIYVGIKGIRRCNWGKGSGGWEKSGGDVGKGEKKKEKCPLLNLPTAQMKC